MNHGSRCPQQNTNFCVCRPADHTATSLPPTTLADCTHVPAALHPGTPQTAEAAKVSCKQLSSRKKTTDNSAKRKGRRSCVMYGGANCTESTNSLLESSLWTARGERCARGVDVCCSRPWGGVRERRELHWSMGQTALPGSELPDYSDTEISKEEQRQRQPTRTRTAVTTRVHRWSRPPASTEKGEVHGRPPAIPW